MLQNNEMRLTRTKMDPKSWKFRSWTVPATRPSLAAILSEWHRLSLSSHRMWVTVSLSLSLGMSDNVWVCVNECLPVWACKRHTHAHSHSLSVSVCVRERKRGFHLYGWQANLKRHHFQNFVPEIRTWSKKSPRLSWRLEGRNSLPAASMATLRIPAGFSK